MAVRPLHLGWFMNFTPGEWDSPMAAGGAPWDGKFYVDMAQALERACFDYIMIEDTLMVSEAYGDSAEAALKHALQVPKHDPSPLAALISAATTRLGVVATLSTLAYPPFMLARLCSTLDHISGGRFGWNIVTSGEDSGGAEFRPRQAAAARTALRDGRRIRRSGLQIVRFVGSRRGGDGPRHRHLRRPPQGPADPLRGQVLQGARPAEHRALAAGQAGVRAGRRLAPRPRVRREARRFDHRHGQRHRRHEAVPRRCAAARGLVRAQSRTTSRCCSWSIRSWRRPTRRPRRNGSAWCPRRTSSPARWPARRLSPTSISPSMTWTSRCRG